MWKPSWSFCKSHAWGVNEALRALNSDDSTSSDLDDLGIAGVSFRCSLLQLSHADLVFGFGESMTASILSIAVPSNLICLQAQFCKKKHKRKSWFLTFTFFCFRVLPRQTRQKQANNAFKWPKPNNMSVNLVLVCSSSYEFRDMQSDTDSQSFTSSPMLLSLRDRKATLATFVNSYASNSLKRSRPRFNEDVVAMMYVAVDCIANSRSIIALPSEFRDETAMHVAHCLVHTYNLARGNGDILGDGPTFGTKAASTREVTATEVARAG